MMRICPVNSSRSIDGIAKYIRTHFDSDNDKLRAAYSWVAQHITYDVGKMYVGITYKYENEVVEQVLKHRRTVCFGYVVTFKAIAESLGIKIVIVKGYTKQNGRVDAIPHAWCAVRHGKHWRLIDPTWSAGYLSGNVFQQRFNDKWFLVRPENIIRSHIPFDPVWQFSYFPVNAKEFAAGTGADSITSRFFNYPDTVLIIELLPEKERLASENGRILSAGHDNPMALKHVQTNKSYIEYLVNNENVGIYNRVVGLYNAANNLLYNGRNPRAASAKLNEAMSLINTIQNPDRDMSSSVRDMKKYMKDLEFQIRKKL
jgi:hypothetical protein